MDAAHFIPYREPRGKRAGRSKRVAPLPKSAKLGPPGRLGVDANVQQVYAIHSDRDGARHRDGGAGLQLSPRQPGGYRSGRKPDRDAVPAADQDDHRALGVRHAGRRHRPYGERRQAGADLCKNHGLVRQRLVRLAAARPRDGQPAAARRQFPGHPAGQGAIDRIAGVGVLDREIPDPPDSDLDRGRDGAERNPADRGVRGVLLGRARRDAGALQADAVATTSATSC